MPFRFAEGDRDDTAARTETPSVAFMRAREVLDNFCSAVEAIRDDTRLGERLAQADTTVRLTLADQPELGVTLVLDQVPIEVDPQHAAEVEIVIASEDLARLGSEEFDLALAIAQGEVHARGPVRPFLRVAPILGYILRQSTNGHDVSEEDEIAGDDDPTLSYDTTAPQGGTGESWRTGAPSVDPGERELLDHAAEYAFHEGGIEVAEERPGWYWSIEFVDVHKSFGSNRVLNGLNIGIPEGMITVILGPSGVGKSVMISHIVGLLYPDAGDVLVHGVSVPGRKRSELLGMRRRFGMLFQDGALFGSMNLYDNVAFPLREHTNMREREIRDVVMSRLEDVGLADAVDRMPNELSGGMRKRAGFARALVLEPEVVIFDEPDSGLDPVRTALLTNLIRELHDQHGGTYIVVTHDIESTRALGGYTAVLWKGRIVQAGTHAEMFNSDNPFVSQFLNRKTEGPLGMR